MHLTSNLKLSCHIHYFLVFQASFREAYEINFSFSLIRVCYMLRNTYKIFVGIAETKALL